MIRVLVQKKFSVIEYTSDLLSDVVNYLKINKIKNNYRIYLNNELHCLSKKTENLYKESNGKLLLYRPSDGGHTHVYTDIGSLDDLITKFEGAIK